MTKREILESLRSRACPSCGGTKRPKMSHCRDCYFKLPEGARNELYQRFGGGYEDAFIRSLEILRQTD